MVGEVTGGVVVEEAADNDVEVKVSAGGDVAYGAGIQLAAAMLVLLCELHYLVLGGAGHAAHGKGAADGLCECLRLAHGAGNG